MSTYYVLGSVPDAELDSVEAIPETLIEMLMWEGEGIW